MASSLLTLPLDLIRDILYRVPAESLVRTKTTRKQLYTLINDKEFIYGHLARSEETFLRTDQTVQILDLVNKTRSDSPIPDDFQPNILSHGSLRWTHVVHVEHGIIIIRQARPLESPHKEDQPEVEIFDCNTKSWKILDVGKVDRGVRRYCNGVSVDGNMYWLGRNQKRNYILGFDFSLEKFNDIYLFPCDSNYPDEDTYLGGYNGDCLSLVEQNQEQTSPIVVSVSSKLANGNVSFTKYFSVARPDLPAAAPTGLILYQVDETGIINQRETARDYMDDYAGILQQDVRDRDFDKVAMHPGDIVSRAMAVSFCASAYEVALRIKRYWI
ncbi:hypothetical protein Bca101_090002 [Brassica carinata]